MSASPNAQQIKSGSLAAVSAEVVLTVPVNAFEVAIQGTFVGTLQVQRRVNGTWYVLDSFTAPASKNYYLGAALETRVVMTARTSGAADVMLAGAEVY